MLVEKYQKHVKTTFLLAYPVMLSQLGQVLVGVADSMMVGQLGAQPLGAASLANSIFMVVLMFGIGISYAVTPLVAAADGQNNRKQIREIIKNGLLINTVSGFLLFGVVLAASNLLYHMEQPVEVVRDAIPYLGVITFSIVPLMIFQSFKQFAEGLSQTKQAMYITIFGNGLNVLFNYILIFGKFGFEPMGLMGAGWATLISRILMAIMMIVYVLWSKRYKKYFKGFKFKKFSRPLITRMVKIGVPTGLQFIFEVGAFSAAAIMMGWLGVNQLASHQIAINLASVSYMMASGLSAAATVRVGNQLGKGDIQTLREAGFTIFGMVAVFMLVTALIFVSFRFFLPSLYIDDVEVIQMSAGLLIIAAFFQLSDGIQVVGLGAMRGMSDVKVPTIITLVAYWVLGLPIGYLLGFQLDLGAQGIWIGLLIGLTVAAVLLFYRFDTLSKRLLHKA